MTSPSPAERHLDQVARGGALGLVGAAVSAIAGFALVAVVTRTLDPHDAGVFFAATSAFLMISAMASLGTDAGLARFVLRLEADDRAHEVRRLIGSVLVVVVTASVLSGIALALFAEPLAAALGWSDAGLLVLFAIALPLAVVSDFALAGTRAFGRMRPTVLVDRFIRAGGQAVVASVVVLLGHGVFALTIGWLAAYAVAAVLATAALTAVIRDRRPPGLPVGDRAAALPPGSLVPAFWRFTWPRGLTRLGQIGIQKADIVLVAALLSPADAAVYTAATRFVALGQFATQALQQVLQPRFTEILVRERRETLREVYQVATNWNVLLTWPVYLVVGCAPVAYLGLFGSSYATSADARVVVVVMMLAMLLAVASGPVDTLLLMAGRSGRSLANASIALAVDIALCLLLLPRFGIAGAALAWAAAVLTRCGLAVLQVRAVLRIMPAGPSFGTAVTLCLGIVGAPMALASVLGLRGLVGWTLLACLLGAIDLAVLHRLRAVPGDPIRLEVLIRALRRTDDEEDPCTPEQSPPRPATFFPIRP